MRHKKKITGLIILFIVLALSILLFPQAITNNYVAKIIDGDTFELSDGTKVRLLCVNTPETGERFYTESKDWLANLILYKQVRLERDVTDEDEYGRKLRYVFVDDIFINRVLLQDGLAEYYPCQPNQKYTDRLIAAEQDAKNSKMGIWS